MVDRINNNQIQQVQPHSTAAKSKQTSQGTFLGKAVTVLFSDKKQKVQLKSDQALQKLNDTRDARSIVKNKASAIVELINQGAISSQDTFKELIKLKKEIQVLSQNYLEDHTKFEKSVTKLNSLAATALRFQGRFKEAERTEERFSKSKSTIKEEAKNAAANFEAGLIKSLVNETAIMEKHIKSLFN